ncbi:MAG: transposase zinc-binding domain-containing protein [Nitrosomonas sp.]|nr:transposase zinc-binding domain-containing protein [Nitrosomonas sp.]
MQEHIETFFAQVELVTGSGLPDFVKEEFDAFLECGVLAHGFLRLRCADCTHEKLVAFSCKRRGFCPSCGGRRMAQTAAHLVDHVIPNVPVRQWVLSLPIPLRVLFAAHPHLLSKVLQVISRAISTFLIKQAGFKRRDAQTGAITLIQRFGSAANLNIHLHCLVLDGVYHIQDGVPVFHGVRTPTTDQLQRLLSQIIQRIMKALTRHGALIEEEGMMSRVN